MSDDNLKQQVFELTQRIQILEMLLGVKADSKLSKKVDVESKVESPPTTTTTNVDPIYVAPTSVKQKSPIGARLLGAVAIFCFLVAGLYFVGLAIENGWLTPVRQLSAIVLTGLLLVYFGLHLRPKHGNFSGHLAGAGLLVLYLSVLSGQAYWQLFSLTAAIGFVICISAIGLYLFRIFSTGYFIVASVLGTYLMPIVLHRHGAGNFGDIVYFFLWDVTFVFFAVIWRERSLIALTAYTAILGGILLNLNSEGFAYFQLVQFFILLVGTAYYSLRTKSVLTEREMWTLFPAILLFYGSEYAAFTKFLPGQVNWLAIAFALVLLCVSRYVKLTIGKSNPEADFPLLGLVSIILFHAGYLELAPETVKPWIGIGILAVLIISRGKLAGFSSLSFQTVMAGLVVVCEVGKLIFDNPLHDTIYFGVLLPAVYGGLLVLVGIGLTKVERSDLRIVPHFTANVLILMMLSNASDILFGSSEKVFAGYLSSALWAVYAVGLLVIGRKIGDSLIAKSALFVFGIVALKILVLDSLSQGIGFRIIMLLIIGTLFYLGGVLYGKINEETPK